MGENMTDPRAIRFGAPKPSNDYLFKDSGGDVALDLANTLADRPQGGRERLTDYGKLIRWSELVGMLTEHQSARLLAAASKDPVAASRAHAEALELRELIFATVKAAIGPPMLHDDHIRQWNVWLERIQSVRRLSASPHGLEWQAFDNCERLDGVVLVIAEAAIKLFLDPANLPRLRLCASDNCDWAFLDTSRRQNRVWCDMTICGNRAKAARHYHRKTAK
jgi:predicted RNA-binding Zn ribbon-like protein